MMLILFALENIGPPPGGDEASSSWLEVLWSYGGSIPEYVVAMFAVIFIIFGGVIHIRKAVMDLSTTTVFSVPSYTISDTDDGKNIKEWLGTTIKGVYKKPKESFGFKFWKILPRRLWNFYVEAFMIPNYRKEWGKYKDWCFRSPPRPERPPLIKEEMKRRKHEMRKIRSLTHTTSTGTSSYAPHDHSECQRVRINVGGCIYETQVRTLRRFPDTLLGDPAKRLKYYNPPTQEYFFDRNRASFEIILYFYQSGGRLKRTDNVGSDVLLDDLKFYGLPHGVVYQYLVDEGLTASDNAEDMFPQDLLLRKIWLLFDYPESSMQARIVAIISVSSITVSITTFCLETVSAMAARSNHDINIETGVAQVKEFSGLDLGDPFFFCEAISSTWFLVEYLARLFSCPRISVFLKSYMNAIDLIAILPFFFQIAAQSSSSGKKSTTASFSVIRVIRLVRVFRIFKLSRHSRGLKILGKTLQASLNELLLLIFFVMIGVILFSSTVYFAEIGTPDTHFNSIPDGFWWSLITITTVGYGDDVPKSSWGKVVGALCAVAGVLTIALPVPVIVSNFNFFYTQALGEQDLSWMKISHVPHCPFRPVENFNGAPSAFRGQHILPGMASYRSKEESNTSDEEFGNLKYGDFQNKKTAPSKK